MLDYLEQVENRILQLLNNRDQWNDLLVTYEKPTVERLWMQDGDNRIYLHRIHPCSKQEAYFHRHPWPSAIRIIEGTYEMELGIDDVHYHDGAKFVLTQGSSYEMTNPDAAHSVRPLHRPTLSLMVTGPRWTISDSAAKLDNGRLTQQQRDTLFEEFEEFYSEYWINKVRWY